MADPQRDIITGRKIRLNVLNKKKVTNQELDDYFLEEEDEMGRCHEIEDGMP